MYGPTRSGPEAHPLAVDPAFIWTANATGQSHLLSWHSISQAYLRCQTVHNSGINKLAGASFHELSSQERYSLATLRIYCLNGVYSVSSDPAQVAHGDNLTIIPPEGTTPGCLLCFNSDFCGKTSWLLTSSHEFDLSDQAAGTSWSYDIYDPSASCPNAGIRSTAHSIQIDGSSR